jgi:FixJ family two-component response regulator
MRLAVVDDDNDVRTALSRLLSVMGHEVSAFASAEALEAGAVVVDCAIVDIRLPGRSGFEVREWLRNLQPPIPAVLISGDGHRLARDESLVLEGPLVTKPFDADSLATAIRIAMSNAKSGPERHVLF